MLIGLSPEQADDCIGTFAPFGLRIYKVAHLVVACERMHTLRPLVVVIGEDQVEGDALERLREAADATAAQIVVHREQLGSERRKLDLLAALRAAVAASGA
jgi:hypothetical protein